MKGLDREEAWRLLAAPGDAIPPFDPAGHPDLPAPAQRLLSAALPPGHHLPPAIELEMRGEIKLRRWVPFTARQVLRIGKGFVWSATAGTFPLTFTGGDVCREQAASLDFRLWNLIPVVRTAGPDVVRSAHGRLAAETAAWAPQGLTPAAGATWAAVDGTRSTVALPVAGDAIEVTVTVGSDGSLDEVTMQRWGNPDSGECALHPFGGSLEGTIDCGGIRIARSGRIGWHWGTSRQAEGEFFRFEVTKARPAAR